MSKKAKKKMTPLMKVIYTVLFVILSLLTPLVADEIPQEPSYSISLDAIPAYDATPYVVIDGNRPDFLEADLTTEPFETFAALDSLGRCGVTYANVCRELMPTEDRGDISSVYPSGWDNNPYDFVDGRYLYNRCHLIGFQLTGENANERNLITGTRYMNVQGMLPFENMVADHVKEEWHHVLYRVTPIYQGSNLVASGVQMEALCVECARTSDTDDDFFFHVYCYNVQPGVEIDYATGANWEAHKEYSGQENTYIINTSSRKFHNADCSNAGDPASQNREKRTCTRQELIDKGYSPAGCCNP